jgi:hypothetical protein
MKTSATRKDFYTSVFLISKHKIAITRSTIAICFDELAAPSQRSVILTLKGIFQALHRFFPTYGWEAQCKVLIPMAAAITWLILL